MVPENSLPCSQESGTGLCPEPDESGSHPHIIFVQDQYLFTQLTPISSWLYETSSTKSLHEVNKKNA
jgi:hypothetical protein